MLFTNAHPGLAQGLLAISFHINLLTKLHIKLQIAPQPSNEVHTLQGAKLLPYNTAARRRQIFFMRVRVFVLAPGQDQHSTRIVSSLLLC